MSFSTCFYFVFCIFIDVYLILLFIVPLLLAIQQIAHLDNKDIPKSLDP